MSPHIIDFPGRHMRRRYFYLMALKRRVFLVSWFSFADFSLMAMTLAAAS